MAWLFGLIALAMYVQHYFNVSAIRQHAAASEATLREVLAILQAQQRQANFDRDTAGTPTYANPQKDAAFDAAIAADLRRPLR